MARTTTNYGWNISEGSDAVNPLVDIFPNFEDQDTVVKAISDDAVGAATELTTGTVHALTRATGSEDRNVFTFVATSNFVAGDTFTLDGNQVSALTPDGQTLASGSYVIGSTVLVALHDTLMTVFVNPAKAKDSDKLDGEDSSYYAKASDISGIESDVQNLSTKVGTAVLTTTAPDLSGAVNELNAQLTELTNYTIGTPVIIAVGTPYTCPSDGYIHASGQNGYGFTFSAGYSCYSRSDSGTFVPVKKGMTISNLNSQSTCTFLPLVAQ